jgi:hypothetical protein
MILEMGAHYVCREEPLDPCCRDLAAALSFETGRHFFVEGGALKLLVAQTPLLDGGDAELENTVRYCPFCGMPTRALFGH